jgi:hypothetical protein
MHSVPAPLDATVKSLCAIDSMVQCFERAFREKEYFMIEVRVKGVARTPDPFLAGVILERLDNQEVLPIFIGMLEAESCFLVLANIARPRPQSHDLAKNLLDVLGAKIDKVVVTDLQDNSYYAVIHLLDKGATKRCDRTGLTFRLPDFCGGTGIYKVRAATGGRRTKSRHIARRNGTIR